MFINDYVKTDYNVVFHVEDGDHKIKISGAETKTAKSGKQMIEIKFVCAESKGVYIHFMVEGDSFGANATKLFDCMGIPYGDFNFTHWVGREVVANFKNEPNDWTDKQGMTHSGTRCNLKYFVLPAAKEEAQQANTQGTPVNNNGKNIIF